MDEAARAQSIAVMNQAMTDAETGARQGGAGQAETTSGEAQEAEAANQDDEAMFEDLKAKNLPPQRLLTPTS